MLIKLAGHFVNNPQLIDKIISIKGLPFEWFFRHNSRHGGYELVTPWEVDVNANIPASIRHLCEEHSITVVFPPIEKGRDSVVEKRNIPAVKLDYSRGPGQEMWERIERYLEQSVPRDQLIPKPVLCAPNQKSEFSPHEVKRNSRGSLELRPAEVPEIDVTKSFTSRVEEKPIEPQVEKKVTVEKEDNPEESKVWECKKCGTNFTDLKLYRGHNLRCKKVVEKVEV